MKKDRFKKPWLVLYGGVAAAAGALIKNKCNGRRLAGILSLLLVPLLFTSVRAQKITASQFFSLPLKTAAAPTNNAAKAFQAPWLDNAEFRTETRDFDFQRQQYTLRLSPSTPGKARAQKSLYDLLENRPDFETANLACDALRQRYEDWLDLYLITTEQHLLQALDSILDDRKTVLNRQSAALDFNWSDLLDLRKEQTELDLRQLHLSERRRQLLAGFQLSTATLDFTDFPRVADLELNVATITPKDPETTYKLELTAREIALERAEGEQFLDFVQAQYQGPHGDPFAERFSIGVGFQFPTNGNRTIKIRELELEQLELQRKQQLEASSDKNRDLRRLETLQSLVRVYTMTRELFAEEAAEMSRVRDNLTRREGFNPLPILDILARNIKNQLRALDGEQEILERYLELREDFLCEQTAGELWRVR